MGMGAWRCTKYGAAVWPVFTSAMAGRATREVPQQEKTSDMPVPRSKEGGSCVVVVAASSDGKSEQRISTVELFLSLNLLQKCLRTGACGCCSQLYPREGTYRAGVEERWTHNQGGASSYDFNTLLNVRTR